MANERSCAGCKYLYAQDEGYSNWTVLDTEIRCAKKRNPNLPAMEPWDWNRKDDSWAPTMNSRCEIYAEGPEVRLDVDGDDTVTSQTTDPEAIAAICADSGSDT